MNNQELRALQLTELEILCAFDDFCKRYNLHYSLCAGTAIGAARHSGFIPWDDDIDITMTRENYTLFCRYWENNPIEGFTFQNYINDPFCGTNHAKMRKKGTMYLTEGECEEYGNHEIWIDILPMDKISDNSQLAKKTLRAGKRIMYITRSNVKMQTDSLPKRLVRSIIHLVPSRIRRNSLKKSTDLLIQQDKAIVDNYKWCSMSCLDSMKIFYPQDIAESYTTIKFENRDLEIFSNFDKMLRVYFNDYMVLPPKEKQIPTHNPIKLVL